MRHQNTHTGKKTLQCHQCNKKFSQKENLVSHQCVHTEEKPQKAATESKLLTAPILKTDFQSQHNNRFIRECYIFHQLIMKKYNLTHHIHTGEKPYSSHE